MKILIRGITMLLTISVLLTALALPLQATAEGFIAEGFEKISETDGLVLYANMNNGEFAVEDKTNGYIWWSNPRNLENDRIANKANMNFMASQIYISYTVEKDKSTQIRNNINSYMFSYKKDGLKVGKANDGIITTYDFPDDGIKLAVRFSITGRSLTAEIETASIEEKENVRLLSVSLLPFFGAGSVSDSGYMMVPDGSGALINFNNNKSKADDYKQPVYGYDPAVERFELRSINETLRMPVFGIKNGGNAFIGIIEKGEANTIINAAVSGKKNSYNDIYPEFNYRVKGVTVIAGRDFSSKTIEMVRNEPVSLDSFSVRYSFIAGDEANYTGMALVYKKYLQDEKKLNRAAYEYDKVPFYLELYGGIMKKKSFLGIPYYGMAPLTKYGDVPKIIGDLRSKGIKDIVLKYSGWMTSGLDNEKVPVKAKTERKLGSEADFIRLQNLLKNEGVDFYPDAELLLFQKNGNGIIKSIHSTKTIAKLPAQVFSYFQSVLQPNIFTRPIRYMLAPGMIRSVADQFTKSYKKYGCDFLSVGSIGSMLYSDFGSRGDDRCESQGIWESVLSGFTEKKLSLMADKVNSYAFPYVDHILSAPDYSSDFDIMDETIPFYQIVLSGLVPYSTEPINLSSQPDILFLKAAETGSYIMYSGTMSESSALKDSRFDNLYSTCYKDWLEDASVKYKSICDLFSQIGGKSITGHSECGFKVYKTEYENGVEVITNYSDDAVMIDGYEVKARDFRAIGGNVQ